RRSSSTRRRRRSSRPTGSPRRSESTAGGGRRRPLRHREGRRARPSGRARPERAAPPVGGPPFSFGPAADAAAGGIVVVRSAGLVLALLLAACTEPDRDPGGEVLARGDGAPIRAAELPAALRRGAR